MPETPKEKREQDMSARLTRFDFDEGDEFELTPRFEGAELAEKFAALKGRLLGSLLEETETVALFARYKLAANEAASLAWTTEFPLLVYPGLLEELARRERAHENRQREIHMRTEQLLEAAV